VAANPFVHCHLHSQYSLLDGAIKIDPLFERAAALGMPAVSLTDHGNLFGAVEFYEAGLRTGVKPIIGCEVYVASGSRFEKEKRERDESGFDAINHLILLAMNDTGYQNLIYLVSKGYLEGFYYRPRIDLDLLRDHHEGLIATSGCLSSMVSRAITGGQTETAWKLVEDFAAIFEGRYYLELQRHGIGDQDRVNAELARMSIDMHLPLLATNDAHYLNHHDHEPHDALLCIGTGTTLDDPGRFRFDGEGFYLTRGRMEWFKDLYVPVEERADPRASPLLDEELAGQPPAHVITAGFDPLRAEGRAYADALQAAGVSVTYENYEGVIHGFVNMVGPMSAARAAYDDMVSTFRALLHG